MRIREHPLVQCLLSLGLSPDDFAVVGSGPLLAHGLRQSIVDVDILARGVAWEQACRLGLPQRSSSGIGDVVTACGGSIEIFNAWPPGDVDAEEIIDRSDVIEGIRFAKLEDVLAWKRKMSRPKDKDDIALLEKHLRKPAE